MARKATGALLVIVCLGSIVLAVVPAAADWLVLQNGSRIETKGPWEVKGKMIVFTLPNGTLSSLRATEVDVDASQAVTDAPPPVEVPEEEAVAETKGEPVLILTDDDVGHVDPMALRDDEEEESEEGDEDGENSSPDSAAETPEELAVVSWSEDFDVELGGVVIGGAVKNNGKSIAMQVVVTISLLDESGELIARTQADLTQPSIPPGRTVSFRSGFQGVSEFSEVSFDIKSRQLRLAPGPPAGGQA